jgi:hypothetical protein
MPSALNNESQYPGTGRKVWCSDALPHELKST